jgi:hypothetical protein
MNQRSKRNRKARNAERMRQQTSMRQKVRDLAAQPQSWGETPEGTPEPLAATQSDDTPVWKEMAGVYLAWLAPYLACAEQMVSGAGEPGVVQVALQLAIVEELQKLTLPQVMAE